MALNYEAQHQFGQTPAWSFVDDQSGERIYLDNPMQAMQLGAPVGAEQTPLGQSVQAPAPMQAPELAMGMFGNSPPPAGTPPVMNPSAGIVGMAPSVSDTAPSMSEDPSALQSTDPSALQSTTADAPQAPQAQQMAPPEAPAPRDPAQLARGINQRNLELLAGDSPLTYSPGRAASPARFEPTQRTSKGDPVFVQDLMQSYSDVAQYKDDTAFERLGVETQQANKAAEKAMMDSIRLDVQQADASKLRDQQKTEYDRRIGAINTELQNVSQKKVNPNRFWDDADAGTTLLAGIALAMGAFGSSMNGGPNQAMQIINDYIDRDTERQMDEIRSAKEGVDLKRNAFQEWLANGNDWKQTEQIVKTIKLEHAEAVATNLAAMESRQDIKLAYRDTIAAINKEKLDVFAGLEQNLGASLTEKFLPEQRAVAGGWKLDQEKLGKQGEIATALAKGAAELGVDPAEMEKRVEKYGQAIGASTPSGITAMQIDVAYDDADRLMQELAKANGGELPGVGALAGQVPDWLAGEGATRLRSAMRNVVSKQLRFESGAVASEEEKAALAEEMARIDELMTDETTALQLYMDARRRHNDTMRQRAAAYGGAPVLDAFKSRVRSIPLTAGGLDPKDPRHLDLQEPE
jgi:hypothetical protein